MRPPNPKNAPYARWMLSKEGQEFWRIVDCRLFCMVEAQQITGFGTSYVRKALKRMHARSFEEIKMMPDEDLMLLGVLGKKTLKSLRALCENTSF